jgi:hypothetical protein
MGTIEDGRKAYDLRRGRAVKDSDDEKTDSPNNALDAGRAEWNKRHPKRAGQGEQR